MKVTFVHAPDRRYAETQLFGIPVMPVWAYTLAAHLAAEMPEIEISLVDDRFDRLEEASADVFLFSGINQDLDSLTAAQELLRARVPGARFVIGGPICWSFHTAGRLEALAMFDHVIIGDGEAALPPLMRDLRDGRDVPRVLEIRERFPLQRALPMHRPLLAATIGRYYGAVLEVSRGCPFLCEFCDIRVLPDNNRAHVKDPDLVVSELDALWALGARQVLFACDNLIGDLRWANALCDAILAWQDRTGRSVSIYTWLTINCSRHPALLEKLRRAGFDLLFIGVESFSQSSLLETAKLQNTAIELSQALRTIQAYGFVVVAGLIFGFDSDPPDVVDVTLRGMTDSALISGDPSLLTALPGTSLYRRMQLTGRLRNTKLGLGGFKYQTNIRYLKPVKTVRDDFRRFVSTFNSGGYQLDRLRRFYACVGSLQYVPPPTAGYADVFRLVRLVLRDRRAVRLLARRVTSILGSPTTLWWFVRSVVLTWRVSSQGRPLWFYWKVWLVNWTNSLVKYGHLRDSDFDIESVDDGFSVRNVVPDAYAHAVEDHVPRQKAAAQRRATTTALRKFVAAHGTERAS